jgi:hypothetical protein
MPRPDDGCFARWLDALEERHLANLRLPEVTRALRALSSVYVERREALTRGAALDSAGKRAAFALFYGPLHFLIARHIVQSLGAARTGVELVIDGGCGTGAGGAAWATTLGQAAGDMPRVLGIDRHPWAVAEARWTYQSMGLDGTTRREDVTRTRFAGRRSAIVLAFTANELADAARATLLPHLLRAAREGGRLLIIEPLARSIGAWWKEWSDAFRQAGGREDVWRFETPLPDRVRQLDRAAGLDHRVLTARSLSVQGGRDSNRELQD